MSNGNLPASSLRVMEGFAPYPSRTNFHGVTEAQGSNLVSKALYTDFGNMRADIKRDLGVDLTYAELYRPLEVQRWRKTEQAHGGPSAAAVGFSTHGDAASWDLRNGVGDGPGNKVYDWIKAHGAEYGMYFDVAGEYWHLHHRAPVSITKPRLAVAISGYRARAAERRRLARRVRARARNRRAEARRERARARLRRAAARRG